MKKEVYIAPLNGCEYMDDFIHDKIVNLLPDLPSKR